MQKIVLIVVVLITIGAGCGVTAPEYSHARVHTIDNTLVISSEGGEPMPVDEVRYTDSKGRNAELSSSEVSAQNCMCEGCDCDGHTCDCDLCICD